MAQANTQVPTTGPLSPAAFAGDINGALLALLSQNSGNAAPSNGPGGSPTLGQCWIDTTANPNVFKVYDGTSWVVIGSLNTTTHIFAPVTAAAVGAKTNIASAATTDLGSLSSRYANITGTTTITSFGNTASVNNPLYLTEFAGAVTLTDSATLILPGTGNYTTAAGDVFWWTFEGSSTWRCVAYVLASGLSLSGGSVPTVVAQGSPSNVASLTIDLAAFVSAYNSFTLIIEALTPATTNTNLRCSFLGCATHQWSYTGSTSGGGTPAGNNNSDTGVTLMQGVKSVEGMGFLRAELMFDAAPDGSNWSRAMWSAAHLNNSSAEQRVTGGGSGSGGQHGVFLSMSSGNFSCTFSVIGNP